MFKNYRSQLPNRTLKCWSSWTCYWALAEEDMAKHSVGWVASQKRWLMAFLVMISVSTLIAFFIRAAFDSCDRPLDIVEKTPRIPSGSLIYSSNSLIFMKSKLVLLVSHELSLTGNANWNGYLFITTSWKYISLYWIRNFLWLTLRLCFLY